MLALFFMLQTDIDKSIRTKTLKYHDNLIGTIGRWTERGLFYAIGVTFIYFSTNDLWDGLTTDNLPISRIIIDLLISLIAIWLIYSVFHLDKLSVIRGKDRETNMNLTYDLLTEMFSDTKFFFIDDQVIGSRPWTMRKAGKEVHVIFNNSDILINITHKVRFGDMDSPFHVLTNQVIIREIRSRFSLK